MVIVLHRVYLIGVVRIINICVIIFIIHAASSRSRVIAQNFSLPLGLHAGAPLIKDLRERHINFDWYAYYASYKALDSQ